jgi:putative ABC transport system permease protein
VANLFQDLQYTWQAMRRRPGFVIAMVAILALGTGVNTAIFSVVYGIVLRPLPFPSPDHLFFVSSSQPNQSLSRIKTSGPDYDDFRDRNHSFQQIAAVLPYFTETLVGEGEPQVLRCTAASPEFFQTLDVRPLLGRLYRPEEYHQDGVTLLISYNLWQRMFGGDRGVIGRVIRLGDSDQTIIGVLPPLPDIYPQTDAWPTLVPDFDFMKWRGNRFLDVIGRLKPGVSPRQAEDDLTSILRNAKETPAGMRESLLPLKTELVGNAKSILAMLMSAAALVLLIACVNVATLLLARSENRKQEIAVRISLGASRFRILQQLFTENIVIALIGGLVGVYLASNATTLIVAAGSAQLPRSSEVGINLSVLVFTLLIACLTSLLFGFTPSLALLKTDLSSALRAGRSDSGTWSRSRRTLLIVTEVSLSVVLLVGAGLLMRSLTNLMRLDLGFQPDHLVTAHLRLADGGFATPHQLNFYNRIFTELPPKPGVAAVGVADCVPGLRAATASLMIAARPVDPKHLPAVSGCWIGGDYFRATGTPLMAGRSFDQRDNGSAPLVAIVNNAMARRYWPTEDPIGKRINISYTGPGRSSDGQIRWRQIVGVVSDVKQNGLDENPEPALYLPFYQDETGHVYRSMRLFVRADRDSMNLSGTIRTTLKSIEPDLPITVQPMTEVLSQSVGPRHFTLVLLSSFAALATLLAGFGIYGVITYAVARRTKEIGLRMALGASRGRILHMVMKEALVPVIAGSILGGLSAVAGSGLMGNILYRTPPADPIVLLTTVAIMLFVALVAASLPAYRAASTDPLAALHSE